MTKFFVIVLSILSFATLNAQQKLPANNVPQPAPSAPDTKTNSTAIPEPEWSGTVYEVKGNQLITLEAQKPHESAKAKGMGFGGATVAFVYDGSKSPIRATPTATFIVKLEGNGNPSAEVVLDQLTIEKGTRKILMGKVGSIMSGYKASTPVTDLNLNFKKYNGSVLIMVNTLTPGEYAFRTKSGITYLFGVD